MKNLLFALLCPLLLSASVTVSPTTVTSSQAILHYNPGASSACTIQVADMNRGISVSSAAGTGSTVTLTTKAPHGLLTGAVVYLSGTGLWDAQWFTITVTSITQFTFSSTAAGSVSTGIVGVLVDDVNPTLYSGSNLDSRTGNSNLGSNRTFVVGAPLTAPVSTADGNRHSRSLQAASLHNWTLTCNGYAFNGPAFTTANLPLGDTHNNGLPVDPAVPGAYAYPTLYGIGEPQAVTVIDPVKGLRSTKASAPTDVVKSGNSFITGLNPGSAWGNPTGPVASGTATYAGGACATPGPACALFLRADGLTVGAGAAYTTTGGSSLDWATVAVAASTTVSGNLVACLTVDGVTCASGQISKALTASLAAYTFGTGALWDLWQGSGPPQLSVVDVSSPTGTMTYDSGTQVATWTSGNHFNIRWNAGSTIVLSGTQYTIGTVSNENSVTLSGSGPAGNLFGAIDSVSVTTGTGYTNNDPMIFTGLSCTVAPAGFITVNGSGSITTTTMTNIGSGCTGAPAVSLTTPGGVGQTLTANLSGGAVVSVSVSGAGTGYTNNDPMIFTGGGCTTAPVGFITVNGSGSITATTMTNIGNGCTAAPAVTLTTGGGAGQTLAAKLGDPTFTANNFGVLIWATNTSGTTSVTGPATYSYGSASMPAWAAAATSAVSPIFTVNGETGYYSFVNNELYWTLADGSDNRDLGAVLTFSRFPSGWPANTGCGSGSPYQFDPVIPGTFYCQLIYFDHTLHEVQFQYQGNNQRTGTPNVTLPDCASSGQPCIQFTPMTGNILSEGPALNPVCSVFNLPTTDVGTFNSGVGGNYFGADITFQQDRFACYYIYSLGTDIPRTPEGTDGGSVKLVAAASSWATAPFSWCNIHTPQPAASGFQGMFSNSNNLNFPGDNYKATLTATMGSTQTACPMNPFGISGSFCTPVTITGEPVNGLAATLQNVQVGDVMSIDSEYLRVLQATSPSFTSLVVQRGYLGTTVASHAGTTLQMLCGNLNTNSSGASGAALGVWNFLADPLGANPAFATMMTDTLNTGGHGNVYMVSQPGQPVTIDAAGTLLPTAALCPSGFGYCDQTRLGNYAAAAQTSIQSAISISPTFSGQQGISQPNIVDTHIGPCFGSICMDARPFDGGSTTVCSSGNAFSNPTGFLYKCAFGNVTLNRKLLSTLAYVGRSALVDISGPGSVIDGTSANNYKYCVTLIANECVSGSSTGDVYVNAPFVSFRYCKANAIAAQGDDTNSICIGDLGAYTGQVAQMGWQTNDLTGATSRVMGPSNNRWNQQYVFWNTPITPNGKTITNYMRWGDGVRTEALATIAPTYPSTDGVPRNNFLPLNVAIHPIAGVTGATVNFWYPELGPGCTSRQEACVANAAALAAIGSNPFYFASESYSPLACSAPGGCTIAVPVLSKRTVSCQIKYWASGSVIFTGPVWSMVTP